MTKSNLCIVTALFDLGRGEMGTSFSRSFEHYKESFSKLLKINHLPMVIYCESNLEPFIWEYRDRSNTRLIFKTLDDLRNFPFYNDVQKIRNSSEWVNQAGWLAESTQARLELYNPLVMSKQFFLNDATLFNHFDTNYFLWVDAGIANTVGGLDGYMNETFEKRIIKHLNKMLYIAFPYDGTVEVHGFNKPRMDAYAGEETKWVARGGVFGGPKHLINEINDIYYNTLHDSLKNGLMGTEESIFTIVAYRNKDKCNIRMIEGNGLVYKFFEDIQNGPVAPDFPLAIYSLTYNTPEQFRIWVESYKRAYPSDYKKHKKYVVDNSTDDLAKIEYRKLFSEHEFEIIHEGTNLGIQDGRQLVAKHFNDSNHTYYIFFEEDFLLVDQNDTIQNNKGFIRYIPDLFDKSIEILEKEELDYLKMTIVEFFGDSTQDWSWKNLPQHKREEYFPKRLDGNTELEWKSKVSHLGIFKDIAYAVGHFHYCNWPILFNKKGNHTVFLEIIYENLYEQTIMSQAKMHMMEGKLKVGTLLASPINHNRTVHYARESRRENRHYSN